MLTDEQIYAAIRPLCDSDRAAAALIETSIDEYKAIESAVLARGEAVAWQFRIRAHGHGNEWSHWRECSRDAYDKYNQGPGELVEYETRALVVDSPTPEDCSAVRYAELAHIFAALFDEIESRADSGDAPGHSHDVPGIWDSDNGALAGKPCAWCALWRTGREMRGRLAPAQSEGE